MVLDFRPRRLEKLRNRIQAAFPSAEDYAKRAKTDAPGLLEKLRTGTLAFFQLPQSALTACYAIADDCTTEEYAALRRVFDRRLGPTLYHAGWAYCQLHEEPRALELFSDACDWMRKNQPGAFEKTLISLTGLPWVDVIYRSVEILRTQSVSIQDFCERYGILPDSRFFQELSMAFFSQCDRNDLEHCGEPVAELIRTAPIAFVKPALTNYLSKIPVEAMPQNMTSAILDRAGSEPGDEALGLSPALLENIRAIRAQQFLPRLEALVSTPQKRELYAPLAGHIRRLDDLPGGFFAVNLGRCVLLDSTGWTDAAYAVAFSRMAPAMEEWQRQGYRADFWPDGCGPIVSARDYILRLHTNETVRLGFSGFDALYSRDFLNLILSPAPPSGRVIPQ